MLPGLSKEAFGPKRNMAVRRVQGDSGPNAHGKHDLAHRMQNVFLQERSTLPPVTSAVLKLINPALHFQPCASKRHCTA
jgi:hypothetical protein